MNPTSIAPAPPTEAYVDLHIRTATIIRAVQPTSRILALGLAGNVAYAETVLTHLQQRKTTSWMSSRFTVTQRIRMIPAAWTGFVPSLRSWGAQWEQQGGRPLKVSENFALSKLPWSETTQAKWDLRRLLAHRAKDVPMNLFTISDMHYRNPDGTNPLATNYKACWHDPIRPSLT